MSANDAHFCPSSSTYWLSSWYLSVNMFSSVVSRIIFEHEVNNVCVCFYVKDSPAMSAERQCCRNHASREHVERRINERSHVGRSNLFQLLDSERLIRWKTRRHERCVNLFRNDTVLSASQLGQRDTPLPVLQNVTCRVTISKLTGICRCML